MSLLRFFQCVLIVFLPIFVILFLLMSTVFSRCFLLFATHYYPLRSLFHSLLYSISKVFQMVLFTAFSLSTPVILFFHYILCSLFICVLLHSFVNCFFYNRLTTVMLTSWISVSCAFLVLSPLQSVHLWATFTACTSVQIVYFATCLCFNIIVALLLLLDTLCFTMTNFYIYRSCLKLHKHNTFFSNSW